MYVKTAIRRFLNYSELTCKAATVAWYDRRLQALGGFLGQRADVRLVTLDKLRGYARWVIRQGWSDWTRAGYVRAAKRLFAWLHAEGQIRTDPAARLTIPPIEHVPKTGLDPGDMRRILAAARQSARDYAMLLFLADTGARAAGVVGLRRGDVFLDEGRAVVREKTGSRVVYLGSKTIKAMQKWMDETDFDPVFGVGYDGLYCTIERYAVPLKIRNWAPHQWRHGFARAMLRAGASLAHVSQMLGHKGVDITVKFYGSLDDKELQRAHKKFRKL